MELGELSHSFLTPKRSFRGGSLVRLMAKQGELAGMYRIEAYNLIMLFSLYPQMLRLKPIFQVCFVTHVYLKWETLDTYLT